MSKTIMDTWQVESCPRCGKIDPVTLMGSPEHNWILCDTLHGRDGCGLEGPRIAREMLREDRACAVWNDPSWREAQS